MANSEGIRNLCAMVDASSFVAKHGEKLTQSEKDNLTDPLNLSITLLRRMIGTMFPGFEIRKNSDHYSLRCKDENIYTVLYLYNILRVKYTNYNSRIERQLREQLLAIVAPLEEFFQCFSNSIIWYKFRDEKRFFLYVSFMPYTYSHGGDFDNVDTYKAYSMNTRVDKLGVMYEYLRNVEVPDEGKKFITFFNKYGNYALSSLARGVSLDIEFLDYCLEHTGHINDLCISFKAEKERLAREASLAKEAERVQEMPVRTNESLRQPQMTMRLARNSDGEFTAQPIHSLTMFTQDERDEHDRRLEVLEQQLSTIAREAPRPAEVYTPRPRIQFREVQATPPTLPDGFRLAEPEAQARFEAVLARQRTQAAQEVVEERGTDPVPADAPEGVGYNNNRFATVNLPDIHPGASTTASNWNTNVFTTTSSMNGIYTPTYDAWFPREVDRRLFDEAFNEMFSEPIRHYYDIDTDDDFMDDTEYIRLLHQSKGIPTPDIFVMTSQDVVEDRDVMLDGLYFSVINGDLQYKVFHNGELAIDTCDYSVVCEHYGSAMPEEIKYLEEVLNNEQ